MYTKQKNDAESLARLEQYVLSAYQQEQTAPVPEEKTYYDDEMSDSRLGQGGTLRLGSGKSAPPRGGHQPAFERRREVNPRQQQQPMTAAAAVAQPAEPRFDPDEFADFLDSAPNIGLGR